MGRLRGNSKFIVTLVLIAADLLVVVTSEAGIDKTRGHGTSVLGLLQPGYTQPFTSLQPTSGSWYLATSFVIFFLSPLH